MASFKRADLREILGDAYTDEIATKIVGLHLGVVDPLKDDLQKYKAEADKVPELSKQLDSYKGSEDWKAKYEKTQAEFDTYKGQVAKDAEVSKVKDAYRKLLIEENISESTIDSVLKVTDFSGMKLKDDGTFDNVDDLKKGINEKWSGFKFSTATKGANVEKPPKTPGAKMTKEEILKIKDTAERQKAIAENLDLFR